MNDINFWILFSVLGLLFFCFPLLRYWFDINKDYYDDNNIVFFKILGILTTAIVSSIFYAMSEESSDFAIYCAVGIIVSSSIVLIKALLQTDNKKHNFLELVSTLSFTTIITTFFIVNFDNVDITIRILSLVLLVISVVFALISEIKLGKIYNKNKEQK